MDVWGDVLVRVYERDTAGRQRQLCRVQFNTSFLKKKIKEDGLIDLVFKNNQIDLSPEIRPTSSEKPINLTIQINLKRVECQVAGCLLTTNEGHEQLEELNLTAFQSLCDKCRREIPPLKLQDAQRIQEIMKSRSELGLSYELGCKLMIGDKAGQEAWTDRYDTD